MDVLGWPFCRGTIHNVTDLHGYVLPLYVSHIHNFYAREVWWYFWSCLALFQGLLCSLVLLWTKTEGKNGGGLGTRLGHPLSLQTTPFTERKDLFMLQLMSCQGTNSNKILISAKYIVATPYNRCTQWRAQISLVTATFFHDNNSMVAAWPDPFSLTVKTSHALGKKETRSGDYSNMLQKLHIDISHQGGSQNFQLLPVKDLPGLYRTALKEPRIQNIVWEGHCPGLVTNPWAPFPLICNTRVSSGTNEFRVFALLLYVHANMWCCGCVSWSHPCVDSLSCVYE